MPRHTSRPERGEARRLSRVGVADTYLHSALIDDVQGGTRIAYVLEEARRNLEIKSTGFETRLAETLEQTRIVGEAPAALVDWAQEQGLPLKDAPVLAAAVHATADLLVTGDARDFGHLFGHTTGGTCVVTLASALDRVLKSAGV